MEKKRTPKDNLRNQLEIRYRKILSELQRLTGREFLLPYLHSITSSDKTKENPDKVIVEAPVRCLNLPVYLN